MSNVVLYSNQMARETSAWKQAIQNAGGGFQWNSVAIADRFVKQLKTRSYYGKIVYLLPLLGTGINAARIPLIDRLNVGAATNTAFVNADFNQATGLQGNGSSKRLALPFLYSQLGTTFNGGAGFWSLNVSVAAGTQYALGTSNFAGNNPTYGFRFGNGASDINCEWCWGDYANRATLAELRSNSHYYGNRSGATSRTLYKNGASVASNTTSDSCTDIATYQPASYALDASAGFVTYWAGSKGVEYYTDGTLTANEVADFHQLLQSYLMGPTGRA